MNMKKVLIIGLVMVLLMSTLVSAGFFSFLKSVLFGTSVTGYAVLNQGCDTDRECDGGLICDWTSPAGGKKGSCTEFPQNAKEICQGKVDAVIARLGLIKERLKSVEVKSHAQ